MNAVGHEITGDIEAGHLVGTSLADAPAAVEDGARRSLSRDLPARPLVVIEGGLGRVPLDVPHLWSYRELLYFLVWRDIKVRYKQTLLGALWAILQPLVTMIIFAYFFGKLAKVPTDGVPYPIFFYTGLLL